MGLAFHLLSAAKCPSGWLLRRKSRRRRMRLSSVSLRKERGQGAMRGQGQGQGQGLWGPRETKMKTSPLGWLSKLRHWTSQALLSPLTVSRGWKFLGYPGCPSLVALWWGPPRVEMPPAFLFHMIKSLPRPCGHQLAPWQSSPGFEWAPGTLLYFQEVVRNLGTGRGLAALQEH